jgi:hypothetical protein
MIVEDLTAVKISVLVFWDPTLCEPVGRPNVTEKHNASIFRTEAVILMRNVGIYLRAGTALKPRRPRSGEFFFTLAEL